MKQILALLHKCLCLFKALVLGLRHKEKTTRVEIDSNHDGQADIIVTVEHEQQAEATVVKGNRHEEKSDITKEGSR